MKAIVYRRFGAPTEVLEIAEVPRPVAGPGDLLVRVCASSANPYDWHFIRAEPRVMRLMGAGLRRPKLPTPGGDFAGVVEEVGADVTSFGVGDEVYGFHHGAFAEYVAVPESKPALKPANLTFEQAGTVPLAAVTAMQGLLDHGGLTAGQKVLIIGASGGVGIFAVQIAKAHGAEVTGVCRTESLELVRSLGADHVIDYTRDDCTRADARYDLVFQLGGTYPPSRIRRVLGPKGTLILCYGDGGPWFGSLGNVFKAMAMNLFVGQTIKSFLAREDGPALRRVTDLIESGQVRPILDSTYPFVETGRAVARVEGGSLRGKVAITIP